MFQPVTCQMSRPWGKAMQFVTHPHLPRVANLAKVTPNSTLIKAGELGKFNVTGECTWDGCLCKHIDAGSESGPVTAVARSIFVLVRGRRHPACACISCSLRLLCLHCQ